MTSRTIGILFATTVFSAAQAPERDQKATIAGTVVSLATGAPLRKTTLTLEPVKARHNYSATTNAEGKFVLDEIEPGEYFLSAERLGYVLQGYGSRPGRDDGREILKLEAGQHLKDVTLKLIAQGVIAGRVVDEDGDPVPAATVIWMRTARVGGQMKALDWNGAQLDAEAGFVLSSLKAGRYYLKARHENQPAVRESYIATYYPSATDPGGAVPIDIAPGSEVRGLEIQIRKARVVRVRGKIANSASVPLDRVTLMLMPANKAELSPENGDYSTVVRGGVFEFTNVLPGSYVIRTRNQISMDGLTGELHNGTSVFCSYPVTVGDQDLNDIVLPLTTGSELTGSISSEGGDVVKWPSIHVAAMAYYFRTAPPTIHSDGTFHFVSLPPDRYSLSVEDLPPGTYVKSVRYGGQAIANRSFELASSQSLEILLAPNAAQISGMTAPNVPVTLWRKDDEPSVFTRSTKEGSFRFSNLAPGEYRLLAWDDIDPELITVLDFRNQFTKQAYVVTPSAGSTESVDLKPITKAAVEEH